MPRRGANRCCPIFTVVNLDPQTYSGKLRIATGLSMLQGILNINSRLEEVSIPFKVFHGTGDRITNYR